MSITAWFLVKFIFFSLSARLVGASWACKAMFPSHTNPKTIAQTKLSIVGSSLFDLRGHKWAQQAGGTVKDWQILGHSSNFSTWSELATKSEAKVPNFIANFEPSYLWTGKSFWQNSIIYSLRGSVCNKTFPMFSPWSLGQIGLPMTVLESACHEDSETPPTCLIW